MKNFKKVMSLSLAATMLASTTTAFAMPTDTVVIGDQAFDLQALETNELDSELNAAVLDADSIYYNIDGVTDGLFLNSEDDSKMTVDEKKNLENVSLMNSDGLNVVFENFDDNSGVALVNTKAELLSQVNNEYAGIVKLNKDIAFEAENVEISRLVNIDLDGHTLTGNINIDTNDGGEMIISSDKVAKLDGALTIDTEQADFEIGKNISVQGKTTIKDVKSSTFINKGILKEVVIEDSNGSGFQNDGSVESVAIDTVANVTLKGENSIPKVVVNVVDAEVTLEVNVSTIEADKSFKMIKDSSVKVHKLEGEGVSNMHIEDSAGHELKPQEVIDIVKPGPIVPDQPYIPPYVPPYVPPVVVEDTIKPVITLNGDDSVDVLINEEYVELSAKVTDNKDSGLVVKMTIKKDDVVVDSIDTSEVGVYKVFFNATDETGNKANEVVRTVNIVNKVVEKVDKAALTTKVGEANTNKGDVTESADGSEVEPSSKWVTAEVMKTYTDAIAVAQGVINKADATQDQVNEAITALDGATSIFDGAKKAGVKAEKADKAALTIKVGEANKNKGDVTESADGSEVEPSNKWVTEEVMKAYTDAIAAAQAVIDQADATQDQVDGAITALDGATSTFNDAKKAGVKAEKADKSVLTTKVGEANKNKGDVAESENGSEVEPSSKWVTAEVMKAYTDAIAAAQGVIDQADATQDQVNEAITALDGATSTFDGAKADGVKVEKVDKAALTTKVEEANVNKDTVVKSGDGSEVESSSKWVTEEVMTTYTDAIAAAQGVIDQADATQDQVNEAITALDTATSTFDGAKADGTKTE